MDGKKPRMSLGLPLLLLLLFQLALVTGSYPVVNQLAMVSGLVNAIIQEFEISELTLVCEEISDAEQKLDFHFLEVTTRLAVVQDLVLDMVPRSGKLLDDAIFMLDLDGPLLKEASEMGLLERIHWFIPFPKNQSQDLDFRLKLNSRVYMYKELLPGAEVRFYEIYAVKNGPQIIRFIGTWTRPLGLKIHVS